LTGTARLSQNDGPFADIMKMLAAQIERELETETATIGHWAIYEVNYNASGRWMRKIAKGKLNSSRRNTDLR
jgi:hypothetical protein